VHPLAKGWIGVTSNNVLYKQNGEFSGFKLSNAKCVPNT